MNENHSRPASDLLERSRRHEKLALAREGYRFYAKDAEEFAAQSAAAVGEILCNDGLFPTTRHRGFSVPAVAGWR